MSISRSVRLALPVLLACGAVVAGGPPPSGTIEVRQTVQCCYREGSVSYVGVSQVGNGLITTKVIRPVAGLDRLLVSTEVDPGTYVVSSFQRPCDGNCDVLNAPIDACDSEPIEIAAGETVSVLVSVVPFGGCSISVEAAKE